MDENNRDLEVPTRNLLVGPEDSPTTVSIAGLWSGDWQVKTSRMRRKPLDLNIRQYKEDTRQKAERWTRKGEYGVKEVPLQAWGTPEGSRKLKFPDFMTTAQDSGKVVSLTHRPPLPSGNAPGTHFC